jgi:hypothetical protein
MWKSLGAELKVYDQIVLEFAQSLSGGPNRVLKIDYFLPSSDSDCPNMKSWDISRPRIGKPWQSIRYISPQIEQQNALSLTEKIDVIGGETLN